jgi:hypothetical protein
VNQKLGKRKKREKAEGEKARGIVTWREGAADTAEAIWRAKEEAAKKEADKKRDGENVQTFVQAQKKTYKKCLHGDLTCEGRPIDAHSIQNARVLELIQTDGHVLMPDLRLVDGQPKVEFVKVGRNDASTFTGLCSKHDTELFKAIDTEPLDLDDSEHLRQLAYRAVMREFHTHLLNSEKTWAIHDKFCDARGVNPAQQKGIAGAKLSQEAFRCAPIRGKGAGPSEPDHHHGRSSRTGGMRTVFCRFHC